VTGGSTADGRTQFHPPRNKAQKKESAIQIPVCSVPQQRLPIEQEDYTAPAQ